MKRNGRRKDWIWKIGLPLLSCALWGCERENEASPPPKAAKAEPAPTAQRPAPGTDTGGFAEKEKRLVGRLAEEPADVEAQLELANLYYDTNQFELAIPAYQEVLKARPDDPNVRTDLGTCYKNLEKFDRARAEYSQVLKKNPDHVQAIYNLAVVSHLTGDDRRAAELWDMAAALARGTPLGEAAAKLAAAARRPAPLIKIPDAVQGGPHP